MRAREAKLYNADTVWAQTVTDVVSDRNDITIWHGGEWFKLESGPSTSNRGFSNWPLIVATRRPPDLMVLL